MNATNPYNDDDSDETPSYVSGSLIGDLILGEVPVWEVGVCRLTYDEGHDKVVVFGEGGDTIRSVACDEYQRESQLDGSLVVDCTAVAREVNGAVDEEMKAL